MVPAFTFIGSVCPHNLDIRASVGGKQSSDRPVSVCKIEHLNLWFSLHLQWNFLIISN